MKIDLENLFEVREMTKEDESLLSSIDSRSISTEKLLVTFDNKEFHYSFTEVASFTKKYDPRMLPIDNYFEQDKYHVLYAYLKDKIIGQIILYKSWNNYCYIDDIRVDEAHKGMGIGRALIEVSCDWAMEKNLKAIALETQDVNASACRFYLREGFHIGAVDTHKYLLLDGDVNKEISIQFFKFLIVEDE